MARSTKLSHKRIWAAYRDPQNKTLSAIGFEDVMISEDGENYQIQESAEQRCSAFRKSNANAVILDGAMTAEHAIDIAKQKGV